MLIYDNEWHYPPRIMACQRKPKEVFHKCWSLLLMGQLCREAQRLRKPPAVVSHVNVACPGSLQISEVLVIMLRMCPFKLLLWNMIEIPAACCTDQVICLRDFT